MGEIAIDMVDESSCSLCGCYFVGPDLDEEGNEMTYEHGYPVACKDCWEPGCGYPEADVETF